MPQTDAEKAMMATIKAMRKAGKIEGEIKVKDKPKQLVKFRDNKAIDKMIEISRLEKDLQRRQNQDALDYRSNTIAERQNLLKRKMASQTGTGIYEEKITDPNFIDKILDGEKYETEMVEKMTPIPDVNLNPIPLKSKFDIFNVEPSEKLDPLLKEAMEQNKAKELLKRHFTDENGRIAITDLNLQEKILHHPDDVEVKNIGSNKVALVGKSSGHEYFRILPNFAPGTGEPLTQHYATLHGDKYAEEPMEFEETIEDQIEEKKELENIKKREKKAKENYQSKLRMRKMKNKINNS